jgi:SAM-dependent methyltransferase
MGYVFNFNDAIAYEQWFEDPCNRIAAELEWRLMLEMLNPPAGNSLLGIGCGTGENLLRMVENGLQVTGIDPSPYMLDIAKKRLGNRVDLYRGFAEDLPFDDNSFNHSCLVTTLEFVENPCKAIEEACRVTKDSMFIGVLNRYAIKGIERRLKGIFSETIYNRAQFFSIWELKRTIKSIIGDVPISWRTVCLLPSSTGKILDKIERSKLIQKCPFGTFVGIVVTLVPRFRTRPLPITYKTKQSTRTVTG